MGRHYLLVLRVGFVIDILFLAGTTEKVDDVATKNVKMMHLTWRRVNVGWVVPPSLGRTQNPTSESPPLELILSKP